MEQFLGPESRSQEDGVGTAPLSAQVTWEPPTRTPLPPAHRLPVVPPYGPNFSTAAVGGVFQMQTVAVGFKVTNKEHRNWPRGHTAPPLCAKILCPQE